MKYYALLLSLFLFSCVSPENKVEENDFIPYEYEKSITELSGISGEFLKRSHEEMNELVTVNTTGPYQATFESLDSHPTPEWYKDAKLGIFFDWGLYSIAGYGEKGWSRARYPDWYLNHMIHNLKDYHATTWGEDFKRDDFIGMFRAEGFSANNIIDMVKKSGAKYFVPFSKHHDGFCLWDSDFTHRDVVDMNPGRDLTQELVDACEAAGLYHGFYFSVEDYEYPLITEEGDLKLRLWSKRMAPDNAGVVVSNDEALMDFNPQKHDKLVSGKVPVNNFIDDYIVPQAKDFIDKYDPDILWFDGEWQRPAEYYKTPDIVAYFYNQADGRKDVAANDRWGQNTREHCGDFYTSETDEVVEKLCDNTQLGQPVWYTASKDKKYGYAIIFDWPKSETFICTNANISWETKVYMLGYDKPLDWVDTGKKSWGLSAKIPEEMLRNPETRPSQHAWVLRFEHDINNKFH